MNNTNVKNDVLKAIDIIVSERVNSAKFDKTIQATVLSCEDPAIGKYKVKYQDSIFEAYSNNIDNIYLKNTSVYVLIPNNNINKRKIILSSSGQSLNNQKKQNVLFINNGINVLETDTTFELCSYSNDEIFILYDKDIENQKLKINKNKTLLYLQKSDYLKISAIIQTQLPLQQQFNGNYGFNFYLDFYDDNSFNIITRKYVFNVDTFNQNPYTFLKPTLQEVMYDIDEKNFIEIRKIELFINDFPIKDDQQKYINDIFISNLTLIGVNKIELQNQETIFLDIQTSQGYIFDNNNDLQDTIQCEAILRINGEKITNKNLPFYWFKQNLSITTNNEKYSPYGGQGWEGLNSLNIINTNNNINIANYIIGNPNFLIMKKDNRAYKNFYKCVTIYKNKIYSKVFEIINLDYDYNIILQPIIQENTKLTSIECIIKDLQQNITTDYLNFIFKWSVLDKNNVFITLNNDNIKDYAEDFLNDKKIYNINTKKIIDFNIYKCSVFLGDVLIGTASYQINNSTNNILQQKNRMDYGEQTNLIINATTVSDPIKINFNYTFNTIPYVTIILYGQYENNTVKNIQFSIDNITLNDFDLYIYNHDIQEKIINIKWAAFAVE